MRWQTVDQLLNWKLFDPGADFDLEKLFSPELSAQHKAEKAKRKKQADMPTSGDEVIEQLTKLGYRE